MQEELNRRDSKRNFSLLAFGIWLTFLASSFGLLRTIHPGLYDEDLIPLALGTLSGQWLTRARKRAAISPETPIADC